MSSPQTLPADDSIARRNVLVLVAAQAILGAQMPMMFVVGGLAGQMLAPHPCLATLPISLIVFGSMTTASWLSPLMQRYGRKTGFAIGAMGGGFGALVSAYGLFIDSFLIFLLGSYLTGVYMSAHGFYRFAAGDAASTAFRPKAISYVMAGGLFAALLGPQLVNLTSDLTAIPFLGVYGAVVVLNICGIFIFPFLKLKPKPIEVETTVPGRSRMELLRDPAILVSIVCAMVAYALMNLVMTSTPLAMVGCGFEQSTASNVVMAHVFAMYIPSFFTGHLIARFGAPRIIALGLAILFCAGIVALTGVTLTNFLGALILLGLGWNFGFIGATAMLQSSHAENERGIAQGLNDTIVFGCVVMASLASGGLLNCSGSDVVDGWNAVNLAMAPFLALAGGALIWLALRPKTLNT